MVAVLHFKRINHPSRGEIKPAYDSDHRERVPYPLVADRAQADVFATVALAHSAPLSRMTASTDEWMDLTETRIIEFLASNEDRLAAAV
jgi:hypothetical protein